jgi:hypothetical protein
MNSGGRMRHIAIAAVLPLVLLPTPASSEDGQVNTIKETIERLYTCWRPPPLSRANPMDITVIVSFNRAGQILGKPRITFESAEATDNDRLEYRVAVMETLQRCTPMPFTESMAGAAAARSGSGSTLPDPHLNRQRNEHGCYGKYFDP